MKYMKGMFDDWQAQGITSILHEKKGGYAFNKDSIKALENKGRTDRSEEGCYQPPENTRQVSSKEE